MSDDDPSSACQRLLTAQEYALLAFYGMPVGQARDEAERAHATAVAVFVARSYRAQGISWEEIARPLGVSVSELREWLGDNNSAKPTPADFATGPSVDSQYQALRSHAWPAGPDPWRQDLIPGDSTVQ